MVCLHPFNLPTGQAVPCGRCKACRIQRTKEWTLRIMHEMQYHSSSCFLTLTYDDEHLPGDLNLVPRDLQLFFKRLRKNTGRYIKYYAAGEYGTKHRRPHYHAIVFGIDVLEEEIIREQWELGFVYLGTVTNDSAQYVCSYIMDKDEAIAMSEFTGQTVKPFQRCSQGIGKKWLEENKDYVINNLSVKSKGKDRSVPRYYLKKLGDEITDEARNNTAIERSRDNDEKYENLGIEPLEIADYNRAYRNQRGEELRFLTEKRKLSKTL